MKNFLRRVNVKVIELSVSTTNTIRRHLNNERGVSGVIVTIIFGAIIILAVIGTQADVVDTFDQAIDKFKVWILGKLDSLFS